MHLNKFKRSFGKLTVETAQGESLPGIGRELPPEPTPGVQSPFESNGETAAHKKAQLEKSAFEALKIKIHKRLIDELDITKLGEYEAGHLRIKVREAANYLLESEKNLLSSAIREQLIEEIANEALGFGPIEPLLKDPTINDILINGPHLIYVERAGQLQETDIRFKDDRHLMQIIDRIVSATGRRVDESNPLCDARLPDGSRIHVIIPPLAIDGPTVSIRKFSKDPLTMEDLIKGDTLTPQASKLLQAFVEARLNIVISGGTGAGKTTLLNVLSGFLGPRERIVTIEDAAELQLRQRHVIRLETRHANLEGKGTIDQRELFRNALRMRPDRIIVGECRAGECLDMLQAMNTGHDGSMTTLHANSPRDAIRRMETMVMMSGYELPQRAIREQIASAINIIIQVTRLGDGTRRVVNISEIVGLESETMLMQDIFQFKQQGMDANQRIVGELKYTGTRPLFADVLIAKGMDVDFSFLEEPFQR